MKFRPFKKIPKGFTIVELIVSVAIFAFMTAFLVVKYGTFNKSILLTNLAYDVALVIRNAQSYGLNVKSRPSTDQSYSTDFGQRYGVHFNTGNSNPFPNRQVIFYADANNNGGYTPGNSEEAGEVLSRYTLRNGAVVKELCVGVSQSSCTPTNKIDITFKRPDPKALINNSTTYKYAEITLATPTDERKKVIVRSNGQIAVLQGGISTDPSATPTLWGATATPTAVP